MKNQIVDIVVKKQNVAESEFFPERYAIAQAN